MTAMIEPKAARLPRHPEAFSHDLGLRRRRPRLENQAHLKFIRTLRCIVPDCAHRDIQAAHIRMGNPLYGKRSTGLQERPADHWVLPLCSVHHERQHKIGEDHFWQLLEIDPFGVALALFACSQDDDAAEVVIRTVQRMAGEGKR